MTRIIAVALQKGGVGKTTTALHLGHALGMLGRKVLMLDLDPQASLTKRYDWSVAKYTISDVLGEGQDGEVLHEIRDVVIATHDPNVFLCATDSARLRKTNKHLDSAEDGAYVLDMKLRDVRLPYDYVVIDTPPGESALLVASLVAADEVVVPVQLSQMGFEGFRDIDNTVQRARSLQRVRGTIRLEYRAVVPTFFERGQHISDAFLATLKESAHPDYAEVPLPVSEPVVETTAFEKASVPREVQSSGDTLRRSLSIWEMPREDVVLRAGQAYQQLAELVDAYG